jgi:hypothetical protein
MCWVQRGIRPSAEVRFDGCAASGCSVMWVVIAGVWDRRTQSGLGSAEAAAFNWDVAGSPDSLSTHYAAEP